MAEEIETLKKNIISIGRLLWEKELVSGLNGNISVRVDGERILLTATNTCLGLLQEKDILLTNRDGEVLDQEGTVSTEKLMHTSVYKNFPDINAVIHSHTTYTSAYFLENDVLNSKIFESRLYLGEVVAIEQKTPSVTDAGPVVEALKKNNVTVLKNHGVLAMGTDLFACFLLIQCLEESVKIDAISRLYCSQPKAKRGNPGKKKRPAGHASGMKKYKLFSREQIDAIVRLVNEDKQMQELGAKTDMNMDLAVKLDESGKVYSFRFEKGKIADVGNDDGAEFLISAPEGVWRAVFNREIDPFVATTQKKMSLQGDYAKISRWYAPCSRIFELWQQVPVE